jgi:hypothetical protein
MLQSSLVFETPLTCYANLPPPHACPLLLLYVAQGGERLVTMEEYLKGLGITAESPLGTADS